MKIVKILGAERCYLMKDGSKIPFGELKNRIVQNKKKKALEKKEAVKPKKRTYRRRKK